MLVKFLTRVLVLGGVALGLGMVSCTETRNVDTVASQPTSSSEQAQAAPDTTSQAPTQKPDVIYVPTPTEVVDQMLNVANVKSSDRIYDLGSGDGRIVITAAQKYGARGTGIDIDPQRIQEANENAQKAGVTKLVDFRQQDLFQSDFKDATVVTLYLLPRLNVKLRPKLLTELKPGTRIVSHQFDMGEWKPNKVLNVGDRKVYYWIVPENPPANLLK